MVAYLCAQPLLQVVSRALAERAMETLPNADFFNLCAALFHSAACAA